MVHIITPFSRFENLDFYIDNLKEEKIIWHPLFGGDIINKKFSIKIDWIEGLYVGNLEEGIHPNIYKCNEFIKKGGLVDDDYYGFLNDDDWIEENVFSEIDKYNDDVIFISMKRGHQTPIVGGHGASTLIPYKGVRAGEIGIEQIFVKGRVLKDIQFVNEIMFDGLFAEYLQTKYEIKMLPDLFTLFNYLEPGRWNKKIVGENMETIKERFERVKTERRDISEHLDTLYRYASESDTVVELGVNEGISTTAFVHANPKKFYCYDYITPNPTFQQLLDMCDNENIEINFEQADSREIEIPECDLLFIDTLHTYDQLIEELKIHSHKAKKYIIMHDTEAFKFTGIVEGTKGLQTAIDEFLVSNSNWALKEHYAYNNGLTVLQRVAGKEEDIENIKTNSNAKKYLIATSAFANPELLEITMNSLPKDIDNIIYFDGHNYQEIFKEYLEKYPEQKGFSYGDHLGCSMSWNVLFNYAFIQNNYETILIIGSDIEMKEGYFEDYIREFEENNLEFSTARGFGFNCFAVTRKCYEIVGEFDANIFPMYFEDNDYHARVQLSGLNHGDVGNPDLFEHYGSATIRKDEKFNEKNGITYSMNQKYYVDKWGSTPENPNVFTYKTPFNNPNLSIRYWRLDIIKYNKKRKVWNV